jgi:hypothetical protein
MMRNRILVLSSLALIASGALIFACGGDDNNDAGTDSGTKDAKTDTTTPTDAKNDTTTTDTGTDTGNDSSSDAGSDVVQGDGGAATTFMVLRVGGSDDAGSDAGLTSTSTQFFIEERNISDGSLVRTLDVPIAVNGQNQPVTISGSSTSEGHLSTSIDGHYVVFAGFAAAPGVATIAQTGSLDAGILRVIGRVDKAGTIDTTTQLAAFDRGDIRGAVSQDGTSFWASGTVGSLSSGSDAGDAGDAATIDAAAYDLFGGIQYATLGSTGAATNITEIPFNTRVAGIFGSQLFFSSSITPQNGVSSVGTGVPTTTNQTTMLLAGQLGDAGSPYGFQMIDQDASIAGLDVLYIADDSTQVKGGGIQKWVNNGTTWTKIATFSATTGYRGLTAQVTSQGVILLATSTETNANTVVKFLDDGVNLTPTGTVIATAQTNTAFRGIALGPQ